MSSIDENETISFTSCTISRDTSNVPVVEDEVDSRELLKSLNTETSHGTETVSVLRFEAVEIRGRTQGSSVVDLGSDFSVFFSDLRRVDVDTENAGERLLSLRILSN